MAFRIPFNEHLIIEADTPGDVRALLAEFGASLGPRQLPATPGERVIDAPPPPPVKARKVPSAARPRATASGPDVDRAARVLQALGSKAMGTGDLALMVGCGRHVLTPVLRELVKKNLVHSTGATISLRWHLGAKGSSPKEAESRRH